MAAIPAQHISSLSLKRRNQLASSAPSYQGLGNILISSESTPIAKSLGTARRSRQTSQPVPSDLTAPTKDASKLSLICASPLFPKSPDMAAPSSKATRKTGSTSKQTRKLKEKLPNSDLSGRISSPPNPQDETAQHTATQIQRPRSRASASKTKLRLRSRSMSSSHHGEHEDEKPSTTPASMSASRPRTVTLNDEPTLLMFHSGRETRKLFENASLFGSLPKVPRRPKGGKSSAKKGAKTLNKSRARACSSDDADYTFARDSSFETKFYSRSSTPTPRHDDFATSQGYPGPLQSEANDLSVSAPSGTLISALSSVSALHTSHRHHGRAKSAAIVLDDHGKGPEAPQRFVKDDWDMPSVGISQDLTWQQLEKKLTKSIRLEIPDFGSSILKQSEKETHSPTPKPTPSPCAIDPKLIELGNNKKSHRSALRRTPSANGALVGSAICSSFLINGKTPSTPDHQSAHSFSAPPSPSPDRVDVRTHGKVLASDLGLPMDMAHTRCSTSSDDVSLTWQQAIMRSPPKSHNSFPLHSSSADAQLELLEELKPYKKNAQLITVATLKTSAKNVSKKPEAHTLCKSVAGSQRDDRHRRRNSTSSTGYLSSQIPITAGKRSLNLKKCGFGEDAGAIKPCPLSNASEDKSTVLGKLSSSALPLGSSQSGNLVQVDQLANLKTINKDVPSSVCFINQLKSISHSSVSSAPLTGRYKENRLVTPNKARSTSELLQILTPTSASQSGPKGKGPMYAGPHFHNSPSPAALPAPKFSFGS
ncbi:expressed protein [Phakopsora pachyrhizi]|uniref:Expressed protein n=1 Tax=Phakopsora pachyrhizi TaxID=170000 RepID=A0AAV0BRW7_PHAPC|nr:expressed protein [Phakopsora pachyrhizi]